METLYTIDSVLNMQSPAEKFFVTLDHNTYGIRFKGFKLRDCDTNQVFHEYIASDIYELDYFADHLLEYKFPQKILKSNTLGSNLTLVTGNNLVQKLTLIERHFIDDKLVASYRSDYPLFMPNSENNVEFIYSVPALDEENKKKLFQEEPIFAKSDTFIFVDGKLTIHRRANYEYVQN
jgi:hypothetical protein